MDQRRAAAGRRLFVRFIHRDDQANRALPRVQLFAEPHDAALPLDQKISAAVAHASMEFEQPLDGLGIHDDGQLHVVGGVDQRPELIQHDQAGFVQRGFSSGVMVDELEKLAKAAAPGQFLFVTLFLSKPPGDFCTPGSVVIALETVFTDDLTFKRDASLQSPKGVVTWHSTRGTIARPNDLAPTAIGLVRSAVEAFILDIPDHEFEEPLEAPPPLD